MEQEDIDIVLGLLDEVGKTKPEDIRLIRLAGAKKVAAAVLARKSVGKGKPKVAKEPKPRSAVVKAVKKNKPAASIHDADSE